MENLLSVIIPIYNAELYLRQCLDSVIHQTYQNLEIICVNDGSTDSSALILEQYKARDRRIKIIHQSNGGMSSARNTGIKAASGKYITFIDSDDYINSETYSKCIPFFLRNIEVVVFSADIIDKDTYFDKHDHDYFQVHQHGQVLVNPELLNDENVMVWNKIYQAEIIKNNNIQFFEGLWYEDVGFFWQYMSYVRCAYFLEDQFYHYRRHSNSIMFSTFFGQGKSIDRLVIYTKLLQFWQTNNQLHKFIDQVGAILFEKAFYFAYTHASSKMRQSILNFARRIIQMHQLDVLFPNNKLIQDFTHNQLSQYQWIDEYNLKQKIFSIKKFKYDKNIYILGCKIKLKRRKYRKIKRLL